MAQQDAQAEICRAGEAATDDPRWAAARCMRAAPATWELPKLQRSAARSRAEQSRAGQSRAEQRGAHSCCQSGVRRGSLGALASAAHLAKPITVIDLAPLLSLPSEPSRMCLRYRPSMRLLRPRQRRLRAAVARQHRFPPAAAKGVATVPDTHPHTIPLSR